MTLVAAAPSALRAQGWDSAVRFRLQSVDDSTFTFPVGNRKWVVPRLRGIAIDPQRHDVLVAQFVVWRVDRGVATALVTGETTRLAPEHVALLRQPRRRWYETPIFWIGTIAGLAAGFLSGRAVD